MEIYFDNAATTRADDCVVDLMAKVMREDFGNPSSKHMKGVDAERYLKDAQKILAGILKVQEKEIIFTSGGTESNNMAMIGAAMASMRKGRHIISTCFEHPSVLEPLKYLERFACPDGGHFEIQYLPVNTGGHIDLDELAASIRKDTILVSVMAVNNEIGSIMPMEEIGRIVKEANPDTYYHADCVQAYGKMKVFPRKWKIDMVSISGHKIHGPKGSGALYVRKGVKIKPILFGGNQEQALRSGTENVPAIAGLGVAAEKIYENHEERVAYLKEIKDYFLEKVMQLPDVTNHSGDAPHIASVSFLKVRSEVLLHALEDKGVCVSAGSACSSNKPAVSGTLKGIGLKREEYESTLRFTFSCYNTKEEVDYVIRVFKECLK